MIKYICLLCQISKKNLVLKKKKKKKKEQKLPELKVSRPNLAFFVCICLLCEATNPANPSRVTPPDTRHPKQSIEFEPSCFWDFSVAGADS